MKYEAKYVDGWVVLVSNKANLSIYDPAGIVATDWPEGFWYDPSKVYSEYKPSGELIEDYIKHKEGYQAEAKKLLLKEML